MSPLGRSAQTLRSAELRVDWLDETASTNTLLLERMQAEPLEGGGESKGDSDGDGDGDRDGDRDGGGSHRASVRWLLGTDRQTAGRGRHGRRWQSSTGASLTFSLGWRAAGAPAPGLSLAVGCAVADALESEGQAGHGIAPRSHRPRLGLKWPNDLWLHDAPGRGRKLGGILVETKTRALPTSGRIVVVGIGLNVLPQDVAEATSGVACLQEIDADATSAGVLVRIVPRLLDDLRRFEADGLAAFAGRYAARDVLAGQSVRAAGRSGEPVEGVADGVAPTGELVVVGAGGRVAVGSGEVSVRLLGRDAPPGRPVGVSSC